MAGPSGIWLVVVHQLFYFSPSPRLLLYLSLKIHFKARLLELVITLCPPPCQLQDGEPTENVYLYLHRFFPPACGVMTHICSPARSPLPPSLPSAHPARCASPLHMSASRRRRLSYQTGTYVQFVIVGVHVNEDGASPGAPPFFPPPSWSFPSTPLWIIAPDTRTHLLPVRLRTNLLLQAQQAPSGQAALCDQTWTVVELMMMMPRPTEWG